MVLDLIAQLDSSEARRIKTENLLRQLLAARSGRGGEQITEEQLALFEAKLKAQGVNVEAPSKGKDAGNGPPTKIRQPRPVTQKQGKQLRLAREQNVRPMLHVLHDYLLTIPRAGTAEERGGTSYCLHTIACTLKNWATLTPYCSDGDLSIDNNATDRSLRSFAVGRNNWTFFGSDKWRQDCHCVAQLCFFLRTRQDRSVCLVLRRAQPHRRTSHHAARRTAAASLGSGIQVNQLPSISILGSQTLMPQGVHRCLPRESTHWLSDPMMIRVSSMPRTQKAMGWCRNNQAIQRPETGRRIETRLQVRYQNAAFA
jgi:hypothetical protein